jgi:chromosome partitioning protein
MALIAISFPPFVKLLYYVNWRRDAGSQLGDITLLHVNKRAECSTNCQIRRPMIITPKRDNLNKIVILNPKGGCGKSTLATNLAACYAKRGSKPSIMDCDPQASSIAWLDRRADELPTIHGIAAYKKTMQSTRSWQLRIPEGTDNLIVDSPASITHDDLRELSSDSTSIIVPVLPSPMDIHAASRCIADLLLVAKVDRRDRKLAVVANRTRKNTKSFNRLMRFLDSLGIPIIAVLRDSQNFVHSAENGIGVHEMQPSRARPDVEQIDRIVTWLDAWPARRRDNVAFAETALQPFRGISLVHKTQAGSA